MPVNLCDKLRYTLSTYKHVNLSEKNCFHIFRHVLAFDYEEKGLR